MKDPYLYKGVVILRKDGKEIDRREEEIGFRYFHADAEKGFFLNGKPYRLNGVNRHQTGRNALRHFIRKTMTKIWT